jgi:hypothetical protein
MMVIIRKLLYLIFLIPFTFIGMYIDFYWRSVTGYFLVFLALAIISIFQHSTKHILILNVITFVSSLVFTLFFLQDKNYYFKPFSTDTLVLIESLLWLIPQYLMFRIKMAYQN